MSLFLNKDKTRKSPRVMLGFLLGIMFVCVFWGLYVFLAEPLAQHIVIKGSASLTTALHCLVVAALGTAICCLLFLLPDKKLALMGFSFLGVFMLAFYCGALMLSPEGRGMMLYFITLHFLTPVLLGNAVAWAIYLRIRKKPLGELKKSSD